jgi:hypothetical protein
MRSPIIAENADYTKFRRPSRLEALAQTVELIAHMRQAEQQRAAERDAKYHERFTRILDLIENHEHRIERLEP